MRGQRPKACAAADATEMGTSVTLRTRACVSASTVLLNSASTDANSSAVTSPSSTVTRPMHSVAPDMLTRCSNFCTAPVQCSPP